MLIKLWPGYWSSQLKTMNWKVDKDNGKALNKGNARYQKVRRFSRNEFWKNIGCLVSDPTFGIGWSRMLGKEEDIKLSGNKRKRRSIRIKVDLYELFLLFIVFYFILRLY